MKIATWNLERAQPDSAQAQRQRQWMERMDADLWILTETHQQISPGDHYQSVASGPPDRPAAEGEHWVQIWVRDRPLKPLPTADAARTACALVDPESELPWLVYGTVLPWVGSPWRNYAAANGEAFAAALQAQQADWIALQQAYPQALMIVAGDFNQDLNVLPYYGSRRNKQALRHALLDANLECLTFGDNDPVRRLINGQHSNVDHICLTYHPDLRIQRTFAWPDSLEALRGLSDHFGVGIDLSLDGLSG